VHNRISATVTFVTAAVHSESHGQQPQRINLVTGSPGAKYDAEGIGGILNIVTVGSGFEGYTATFRGKLLLPFTCTLSSPSTVTKGTFRSISNILFDFESVSGVF